MSTLKDTLADLAEHASHLSKGDILLNIHSGQTFPVPSKEELLFSTEEKLLMQLIDQSTKEEKERGIIPLCLSENVLSWNFREQAVETPILLRPCRAVIDKVRSIIKVDLVEGQEFVNPMLLRALKTTFDLQLSEDPEMILDELKKAGFATIETRLIIGNFHHHRFDVLRDLEGLQTAPPNKALREILGELDVDKEGLPNELSDGLIEFCDPDQLAALRAIPSQHTVIQGPPGTGKSQVLTNLIAQILFSNSQGLIVSEKRVALDVLVKKLRAHGLDRYVFTATDSRQSREFLAELKENWVAMESGYRANFTKHESSPALLGNLQLVLDTLNSPEAAGGLSFTEFLTASDNLDLTKGKFDSTLPSVKSWIEQRMLVQRMYEMGMHQTIGAFQFAMLRKEPLQKLDSILDTLSDEFKRLSEIIQLEKWTDLLEAMKLSAAAHYFSTDLYRKHAPLLKKDSSQQKKFLKLRKSYRKLINELALFVPSATNWLKKPSQEELIMLENTLERKGLLSKHRFKRLWSKYSILPAQQAVALLNSRKKELELEAALNTCKNELDELGIENVDLYVEMVYQQITDYPMDAESKLSNWNSEKIALLASCNKSLLDLHTQLKLVFQFDKDLDIKNHIEQSKSALPKIHDILDLDSVLTEATHRALRNYDAFEGLNQAIFHTGYQQLILHFPYLRNLQATDLLLKCRAISTAQELESRAMAEKIHEKQFELFETYQQLLRTPSGKLTAEKKAIKERLKKGKSILVKAFAKKRNLPTLRSLYQSEAAEWIRILKPICLSNPSQVARIFPLEQQLFAYGIFDEASQIPLENALGTIYRCQRIVVAGDSQQMSPSSFFKSGSNERTDLLHQATFQWHSMHLKHHYRSEHPGLIQFSNRHFYQSALRAFPSFDADSEPIQLQFVDGIYQEGSNLKEAEAVAIALEKQIKSDHSIGVVAFSQNQLETIRSFLSPKTAELLQERVEQNTLFVKSLENVQGDECDVLLISLGYGKDEQGKFHMRFGPVNQTGGDKRLNVLFSRARKKIHVFTSVKSTDFKISSNEAVDLLRRYLQAAETDEFKNVTNTFFQSYNISQTGNELLLKSPQQTFPNALEMVTFVNVLSQRGWKLRMVF